MAAPVAEEATDNTYEDMLSRYQQGTADAQAQLNQMETAADFNPTANFQTQPMSGDADDDSPLSTSLYGEVGPTPTQGGMESAYANARDYINTGGMLPPDELTSGLAGTGIENTGVDIPGYDPSLYPEQVPEAPQPGYTGTQSGPAVGTYTGQDAIGYGQVWTGEESYLEPYIQNILQDVQAREQMEGTAGNMVAATPEMAQGMRVASVDDINLYGGAQLDPAKTMQAAQANIPQNAFGGAQVGQVAGPQAAQMANVGAGPTVGQIGPVQAAQAAQLGQVAGPTGATVAGVQGPQAAQMTPQDAAARSAQLQQLRALEAMAGGQMSPVIEQQRERGMQNVLAMMASQRGAPTSAVMRTGMEGMAEVNRQAQEQASKMQLDALNQLGGAAGQMRGQEIGLAGQQAQLGQQAELAGYQGDLQTAQQNAQMRQQANLAGFEGGLQQAQTQAQMTQQANMLTAEAANQRAIQQAQLDTQGGITGYEGQRQAAMQAAGFGQEAALAGAEMQQQAAMAEAGFTQQAEIAKEERIATAEQNNAQLRQQSSLANMDAINQRAAQQAQLQQQAGLAGMDVESQQALQDAAYQQEANQAIFAAQQQTNMAAAEFQQTANLTNAEMDQQMQIAEMQVNAQLEGARDQLMGALIAQGVDRYKAEMQVNAEIQMQHNALMKDYFAIRQGAMVEIGTSLIGEQWFNESSIEELYENLSVIRILAGQATPGAQAPTPELGVGGQYNISQGIGAYPWSNVQGGLPEGQQDYSGN